MLPDDWTSARLAFLEDSRRCTLESLDHLIALGAPRANQGKPTQAGILAQAGQAVSVLIPFGAWAIFLSDQPGGHFRPAGCHPKSSKDELEKTFEGLAQSGAPAWALSRPHPVVTSLPGGEERLLLHALATPTRIRGLFLGKLGASMQNVSDTALALLTLTLQVAACQLESLELRGILKTHDHRTAKLEAALERLRQKKGSPARTGKAVKTKTPEKPG